MTEDFIPLVAETIPETVTPENTAEAITPPEIGQETVTSTTLATEPPAIQADPTPMAPAPGWKPLGNQPYKIQVGYVRRPGYECELLLNLKLPSQEAMPLVEAAEKRLAEFQHEVFALVHESRQAHAYRVAHARLEELSAKAAGLKTAITTSKSDIDDAMTSGAGDDAITKLLKSAADEKNLLIEIEASIPRLRAIVAEKARALHVAAIAIGREQALAVQSEVLTSEADLGGLLAIAQFSFNRLLEIGTLRGLIFAPSNYVGDMAARRILGNLPDITLPPDPPLPAYRPQGGPRSMFAIANAATNPIQTQEATP